MNSRNIPAKYTYLKTKTTTVKKTKAFSFLLLCNFIFESGKAKTFILAAFIIRQILH